MSALTWGSMASDSLVMPLLTGLSTASVLIFFEWSGALRDLHSFPTRRSSDLEHGVGTLERASLVIGGVAPVTWTRSEEHTSELQSRPHLVCRLLLEKQNPSVTRHGRSWVAPRRPRLPLSCLPVAT